MNNTFYGESGVKNECKDVTNAGPYDVARWVPVTRKIRAGRSWLVPHLCVRAGFDVFGRGLFVGKVKVPDIGELPAKIKSDGKAYVTFDGREIGFDDYNALVTNFTYRVGPSYVRLDNLAKKYPVKVYEGRDYHYLPFPTDSRFGTLAALNLYWVPIRNVSRFVKNAVEGGYNEIFGSRSGRLYIGRTTTAPSLPENQRNVPGRVSLESNMLYIGHHGIEIAISDPNEIHVLVYQETTFGPTGGNWWPCPIS